MAAYGSVAASLAAVTALVGRIFKKRKVPVVRA
jgi:hypothetical protein